MRVRYSLRSLLLFVLVWCAAFSWLGADACGQGSSVRP